MVLHDGQRRQQQIDVAVDVGLMSQGASFTAFATFKDVDCVVVAMMAVGVAEETS